MSRYAADKTYNLPYSALTNMTYTSPCGYGIKPPVMADLHLTNIAPINQPGYYQRIYDYAPYCTSGNGCVMTYNTNFVGPESYIDISRGKRNKYYLN